MQRNERIYVAGHRGLVGSALMRGLHHAGFTNIVVRNHRELDLIRQSEVEKFFRNEKPEYVFLSAARVGGIHANDTYPADFAYDNMQIQCNIINSAYQTGVKKLLFLGSSCIYPKFAPQPMKEDSLLGGPLEPTNRAYAVAKIAGITLCQSYNTQYGTRYISVMPTNLYGPGDNYHPENSHVLPALIRRFHEARETKAESVTIWGTGKPKREFLFSDDLAEACMHLMDCYDGNEIVNIGSGRETTIAELASLVKELVGFEGTIDYDTTKPDGTPRKLLDTSRLETLGWRAKTSLREGISIAYRDFLENVAAE